MAPVANKTNQKPDEVISNRNHLKENFKKSGIHYTIFKHRLEVKGRKSTFISSCHTKYELTQQLIAENIKNARSCSLNDLKILSRETIFKRKLAEQMERVKIWHRRRLAQYCRQQSEKLLQVSKQKQQWLQPLEDKFEWPQQQKDTLESQKDQLSQCKESPQLKELPAEEEFQQLS